VPSIRSFATGEDDRASHCRDSSSHANGVDCGTDGNNIVDALEAFGAVRALPSAPVVAANSPFADLFLDGGVYKPVATQSRLATQHRCSSTWTATGITASADDDAGRGGYIPYILILWRYCRPGETEDSQRDYLIVVSHSQACQSHTILTREL
jgi:hypothetical protein